VSKALYVFILLLVCSPILIGCGALETLEHIDSYDVDLAPSEVMWKKNGETTESTLREVIHCASPSQSGYKEGYPVRVLSDGISVCMLQKGFSFDPQPEGGQGLYGYSNFCIEGGVFWNDISCKSVRGEYESPL